MAIQITKDLFTSLHVPAGACIPVASASPIHVPPVQHVFSIVMCTHARDPKYSYTWALWYRNY